MTPIPPDSGKHPIARRPSRQRVSIEKASEAARAAGFDVIDAKKLSSAGLFGRFVAETGAIDIGRARLAVNLERIDKMMDSLGGMAESEVDPEVRIGLLKIGADLIGKSNSAAELLIKSAQTAAATALAEKEMAVPAFGPGRPASLTQVNVNVRPSDGSVDVNKQEIQCQPSEESNESQEE